MDIWVTILSSSVVSAIVAGWFSLRSKRNEYENAYFKMVLDKRVAAYSEVDRFISGASVACVDGNNRPYHAMFQPHEQGFPHFYVLLQGAISGKFWLSDELHSALRDITVIAYPAGNNQDALLAIAKDRYQDIAELRTKIERLHAQDMLCLHQVSKFLKSKRHRDQYTKLPNRTDQS